MTDQAIEDVRPNGFHVQSRDITDLARVGSIFVPAKFEVLAQRHDGAAFQAVLTYEVRDGQLWLCGVDSPTHELNDAMRILAAVNSWDEWKHLALKMLSADAAEASGEDIGDAIRRAHKTPVRHTRTRITDQVLREVAKAYREAWAAGEPPTRAVAEHFYKSHSTAARWVGLARERGYLGGSDGTRGGERTNTEEQE